MIDIQTLPATLTKIITEFPAAERIVDIKIFKETWPSTALEFGGIGGSAMTDAFTTVIYTLSNRYYVYFADHIAYVVETPTEKFHEDLRNCRMADCETAAKVY